MSPTQQTFRSLIGIQPSTASTSDSTLVIIDAQNEYAEGHLRVKNVEASRVVIASLLEKYRAAKAPVVHVVHITPTGAPVFTPGTELVEIFRELKPAANESIVEKKLIGSFSETSLQEVLESAGRKKLVLVGYMAHVCVSTTARQASDKGWEVLIVRDGVGDRDIPGVDGVHLTEVVLNELKDVFGTVIDSHEIS